VKCEQALRSSDKKFDHKVKSSVPAAVIDSCGHVILCFINNDFALLLVVLVVLLDSLSINGGAAET